MNNDELYKDIIKHSFGFSLAAIWDGLQYNYSCLCYTERVEIFLFVLNKSMENGILRFTDEGKFLEGSISEQVTKFKDSFPEKEEDMYEFYFGLDVQGNLWTPAGGIWICNDGDKIWA